MYKDNLIMQSEEVQEISLYVKYTNNFNPIQEDLNCRLGLSIQIEIIKK